MCCARDWGTGWAAPAAGGSGVHPSSSSPLSPSQAPRPVLRAGPQPRPHGLQEEPRRPRAHEPHHPDAGAPGTSEAAAAGRGAWAQAAHASGPRAEAAPPSRAHLLRACSLPCTLNARARVRWGAGAALTRLPLVQWPGSSSGQSSSAFFFCKILFIFLRGSERAGGEGQADAEHRTWHGTPSRGPEIMAQAQSECPTLNRQSPPGARLCLPL